MRLTALLFAAALAVFAPGSARADLVITGRDAQKLHCAGLLWVVSERLDRGGLLPPESLMQARTAALMILSQLPGSERDRARALAQRAARIGQNRDTVALMEEFDRNAAWCQRNFLN